MAAPSSSTDICNLALDYIEQTSVNNIESPSTDVERICARWYDETRRRVLRLHSWNFAIKRAQLAKSTTSPLFGYDGAYPLPSDWVRMITVGGGDGDSRTQIIDYEIESGSIITSLQSGSALNIRYVSNHTNVSTMDALFVDLFAIELALRMAFKFTTDNGDVSRLKSLRDDIINEAHGVDGQERPVKRVETSRNLTERRRFGANVDSSRYRDSV